MYKLAKLIQILKQILKSILLYINSSFLTVNCLVFGHRQIIGSFNTIKPILLYGCEIWSSFNLKSSKYRNGITLEKIFSKSLAERLQLKIYKFVLGVHKKSSNFAVFSELGCFPIYFDIVKTTLCYQNRLENLGNKFPVFKASYTESKLNSSKNKPSWYSSSEALCNLVNCSSLINLKPKNFKNKCVAKLRIYFISDWHKTRTNLSDGKLRTLIGVYHADNLYSADNRHFQRIPGTVFWRRVYLGLKVCRHVTSMLRRDWLKLVGGVIKI